MNKRLQKIISEYGLMSRRKAEELIKNGLVFVNGRRAGIGDGADMEKDEVIVDGERLCARPEKIYIMLNKPRGYVTTLSDEKGRKNVTELVSGCGTRVFPVGRLDINSEGLLLLTNDGEFADTVMHPRHEISKKYIAWVRGDIEKSVKALKAPMTLDGRLLSPADISVLKRGEDGGTLKIKIREGRNRQIRRMCASAGLHVLRLKRISEGNLKLGELETGKWRYLDENEIKSLWDSRSV